VSKNQTHPNYMMQSPLTYDLNLGNFGHYLVLPAGGGGKASFFSYSEIDGGFKKKFFMAGKS